jgi:TP901 family phage tail tape measure protein
MNQEQLHYRVTGDAKGFKGAIRQSQNSLNGFQSQIKSAASSLKVLMVGGLGIAAAQALRSAKTFDQSMTQIKSLVGIAGDEVDKMGEVAIEMATKTGKSANEAAEALFFITSAGLRGSEAMQVLEASLKAASVGLGETKTVADLATSALNAYGAENLSATDATDVMVTAVREGKLEASELAQSMGRVLPLASAMGVEFHEVGAAFAALSRTGTNAAEASTQVRGILASLLKPTKQAEEALTGMGLSAEGLRKQLREKGLLSTLKTLQQNFEGNEDAAAQVFGNIRALSGVLDLMGANAEGTGKIFDALTKSVNATNTAFEVASESVSKKLDKALAKLGNSTIPPAKNALLVMVNATNGLISAFEILGDVGGPSGDLKRQIDANKKSLDEFAISGKEAAKEIKNLFSAQTLFGQDIDLEKTEDALLKNILTYERTEDKKEKDIFLTKEQQKVLDNLDKSLLDITNRNIVFGDEIDVTSEKIIAYQEAMVGLLNAGMQPTATAFKNLSTEVNILNESLLESDLLAGRYSEVTNQSTKSSQEFSDSIASVNACRIY